MNITCGMAQHTSRNGVVPPKQPSGINAAISRTERFVREMRRRHVFQIAAGYAAFAFVIIQLADLTYPSLGMPPWAYPATVYGVLVASPVVLILAWIYDITREGIRKTDPLPDVFEVATAPTFPAVFTPRSVAILPFSNLSADPENEYFSDGITEDIIARAARIKNLKVISRTSVMQYKNTQKSLREIGRELGVAAILEGSIRRTGDRVRIVAQLVDARTDAHKWAETYDRVLEDIFAIQTDVANQIAAALQAELSPQELERVANQPTENLDAYDLYLRARHEWNRRTEDALVRSADLLKQALELDPKFALAWAGLADTYVTLGIYGTHAPHEVMPRARDAAEQGLRVDATLVEALTALAAYHAIYQWDFGSATRAFEAAMEMSPQYATAPQWLAMNVMVPQARFEEAERLMARVGELDPLSPVMNSSLAVLEYYKRDYELAAEICTDILAMHPAFIFAQYFRGLAYEQLGHTGLAIDALTRSVQVAPSNESRSALAHALIGAGQVDRGRDILRQLEDDARHRYVSPVQIAQPYVALGEYDRALALLEDAKQQRSGDLIWIGVRPAFDPVRNDPRFQRLVAEIHLVGVSA